MRARTGRILAVAGREWRSSLAAPSGWIVLAIVGLVASVAFFGGTFLESRPASLRTVLLACGWALLATAPATAMRTFSDEFRLKTWETLFASPLSTAEMVLGKALACAGLVALSIVPVLLLALPLEMHGNPDYGEVACGLLGLFLAGFAASCLGIATSSATASQAVAFLGALFLWLGLVVGSRVLVGALPLELAPIAAAADPIRRLEGFALGLFDTASVAFFLAIAVASLAFAAVSLERIRAGAGPGLARRLAGAFERTAFALAVLAASVAAVALFSQRPLRVELDATKTRAYSLAPSTVELLRGLEGDWKVLLFVEQGGADPAVLRQVDEVLARLGDANPQFDARRIDPADPASSGAFEEALASLVASRTSEIARSEDAIVRALGTFDAFRAESASQPAGLRAAASQLPADSPVRRTVEQVAALFAQVSTDGEQFRTGVAELMKTSSSRPLPDIEGARSALAQGFRVWGDQLASAASLFAGWREQASIPQAVRNVLGGRVDGYEKLAGLMAGARQELEALPALELDVLGRELVNGEAAVVAGAGRIAVIPAWRIFPRSTAGTGEDRISYSWGFRGEEVLAGAIRSIASGDMPEVVFMHCEKDSLLRARQDHSDLSAMADALRSAGFMVREWTPGRGDRPPRPPGREQVFVVQPALRRAQLDFSREERLLVDAVQKLVDSGEDVLLTVGRSMLSVLGQADPWQSVMSGLGLEPDAGRVVLELVAKEDGTPEVRPWQLIEEVPPASALASRLRGRAILLNQPLRIRPADPLPTGVTQFVAVEVRPSATRWVADDWRGDGDGVREVPAGKALASAMPVVVFAERKMEGRAQRIGVVGSGGWMLTSVADLSDNLGGGRTALVNPGNRELLLASVAWLSGREDLLDVGLSGREVARIDGLGDAARRVWMFGYGALLGIGPLLVGAAVVGARRRRA